VIHTYRFGPHSKGDDTRSKTEINALKQAYDPVAIHGVRLDEEIRKDIEEEIEKEVNKAFQAALMSPDWTEENHPIELSSFPTTNWVDPLEDSTVVSGEENEPGTVLESLNRGLFELMEGDDRVILLGEDILDPYGGAFRVTKGLSTTYPERVIATPISEAGFIGVSTGMSLRGLRPIVEIMFGDFLTLATDQIINHLSKFRWMYNDQTSAPLVIRTPMGGRRGYGPTHSQTLDKLFLGVPGLVVLAPNDLVDSGKLLRTANKLKDPVLFIENKLLYLAKIQTVDSLNEFEIHNGFHRTGLPCHSLKVKGAPDPQVTLVAYGYMATLARDAMLRLAYEEEIFSKLIIPTQLSPFDLDQIVGSTRKTGRLVTIEEGALSLGWGAEVLSRVSEAKGSTLVSTTRVAALDTPVPASYSLEEIVLPDLEKIMFAVKDLLVSSSANPGVE
jgi:pyruvate/2-oxoglutarate/acetoin dehydrogenase E1 component